jgi:tetratricopeptide (TPR) repeat protein
MKRFLLLFLILSSVINVFALENDKQGTDYFKAGFPEVAKPLLIKEFQSDSLSRSETSFYLGNIYSAANQKDSASYYFNKGINALPINSLNAVGIAMLKIKSNPIEADTDFKNLLKVKGNNKNQALLVAISRAYLVNGDVTNAMVYQDKARSLKQKSAAVSVLLGDIHLAQKELGLACSNYEEAILYDENCKEAYIKYARAYKNANPNLAIDMLKRLKQKEPTFLLADKELADIYYKENIFDLAAQSYEIYVKSGNSNIEDLTQYAFLLFLNHEFAKSLDIANQGLVKSPRNPAFNRLAMYNYTDLKQYDNALKAADLFFNQTDKPKFTYLDYRYYGQALRESKQIDLAIPQFEKALSMDSSKVELRKDISDMFNDKNDYPNAISNYLVYMKSLPEEKKTADLYIDLGKMYYFLGSNDSTEVNLKKTSLLNADSIFAKSALLDPTGYRSNYYRAKTNFALNPEDGSAKPYYEQTLALVESKADVRYNPIVIECSRFLGYYYFLKEDYTQSKVYWNKILAIDPKNEIALKATEGIEKTLKGKKK